MKTINNINRVLYGLLLCYGLIVTSCVEGPLENEGNNSVNRPVTVTLGEITATSVHFDMTFDASAISQYQEAGLIFSMSDELDVALSDATIFQINRESCSKVFTDLEFNTKYYYTTYLKSNGFYFYGDVKAFTTDDVNLELSMEAFTATTACISGIVEGLSDSDKSLIEVGMFYSLEESDVKQGRGTKCKATNISSKNEVSFLLSNLKYGTNYYYRSYVKQGDRYVYGEVKLFVAGNLSLNLTADSITATTAHISGIVEGLSDSDKSLIEVGMFYSLEESDVKQGRGTKCKATNISSKNEVSFPLSNLKYGTKYYYCSYIKQDDELIYGEVKSFTTIGVGVSLSFISSTATTAQFAGTLVGVSDEDNSIVKIGGIYSLKQSDVESCNGTVAPVATISAGNIISIQISALQHNSTYYFRPFVKQGNNYTYGEIMSFKTKTVSVYTEQISRTATSVKLGGYVEEFNENEKSCIEIFIEYATLPDYAQYNWGTKVKLSNYIEGKELVATITGLDFGTKYYYRSYVKQGDYFIISDLKTFTTVDVSVNLEIDKVLETDSNGNHSIKVNFKGKANGLSQEDIQRVSLGVSYYTNKNSTPKNVFASSINPDGSFVVSLPQIDADDTKYFYQYCIRKRYGNYATIYGDTVNEFYAWHPYSESYDLNPSLAVDLSALGSANCYIVYRKGLYKFKTVLPNSNSVISLDYCSILWETFGTSEEIRMRDLIKYICYKDGYIIFETADIFKEGNAVIAAKSSNNIIVWSWHIWFTDEPQGQVYYNNAGTMMDRNLGATSATPGDVGALGLIYQWGRKDPFLGSSSISSSEPVASTGRFWSTSLNSNGNIGYAISNPTTWISSLSNYDWYYTSSSTTDMTRWTTSNQVKSIYDPCPAGWRIPDGGDEGVWNKALGGLTSLSDYEYDTSKEGCDFSGIFGPYSSIWYPETGYISDFDYGVNASGYMGSYWSATSYPTVTGPGNYYKNDAVTLQIENGKVQGKWAPEHRAYGLSVRCIQESK